jgi:hypothetical protein
MNCDITIGNEQRSFFQRILIITVIIILFLVGFCLGTAITCVAYSKLSFLNDADDYSETISNLF